MVFVISFTLWLALKWYFSILLVCFLLFTYDIAVFKNDWLYHFKNKIALLEHKYDFCKNLVSNIDVY